jgi:hypothetical protein
MIKSVSANGFMTGELQKLLAGIDLANQSLQDPEFDSDFLACKRMNGSSGFENTDDTPAYALQRLKAGLTTDRANVQFSIYTESFMQRLHRKLTGWMTDGYEDNLGTHMNREFFASASLAEIAANVAHEFTHAMDYGHDRQPTARRPYSLPYQVERIVQAIADRIVANSPKVSA